MPHKIIASMRHVNTCLYKNQHNINNINNKKKDIKTNRI